MSTLTIIHVGTSKYLECSCVYQNGAWLTDNCNPLCHDHTQGYLLGKQKPHYPVPAIHTIPQRMLRSMELNDVPITGYDLLMAAWYNTGR